MSQAILYSTGCPRCVILKKKLDEKEIQYFLEESVDKMLSLGMTAVPVLKVDGKYMGFSEAVKWVNDQ